MEQEIKFKQLICVIDSKIHATAKKRAIDLEVKFKDYIAALIQHEVKHGVFDGVDIQILIDGEEKANNAKASS